MDFHHRATFVYVVVLVALPGLGCEPEPSARPAESGPRSGEESTEPGSANRPVDDGPSEQPDEPELLDDEIRQATSDFADRYAGPRNPEMRQPIFAEEAYLDGRSGPMFGGDSNIRVTVERAATGESVSFRLEESERFADCLEQSRQYGELTGEVGDEHPCQPLSEVFDELDAPPAHTATEPESCADGCCEFASSGGQFETLNLRRICFGFDGGEPTVEEIAFHHHRPAGENPRTDLWSRTRAFFAAVDQLRRDGDTDAVRRNLESVEGVEVSVRVETSRDEEPYERTREEVSVRRLVDCVLRTGDDRASDCERLDTELVVSNILRSPRHPVSLCEDWCCEGLRGWPRHDTARVTGVCYSEEGPEHEIERVVITASN